MRKCSLIMLGMMLPLCASAQGENAEEEVPVVSKLEVESRLGWEMERLDGQTQHPATGFKGQYINLRIDGQIVKGLTYSYRQRLNKPTDRTFWDATDWLHLDYAPNEQWKLSAGKQVVGIGGYEYDRAPIDLYYCSEFWNNIPCYQLGISAAYNPTTKDQLLLQVCNTPFRAWTGNNKYAINMMWYGSHGWWETIWSINAMQRHGGKWMNYIALGNRFKMGDRVRLDVDYMNRASSGQTFLFKDCSVMSELSVQPHESIRCFAKYTFDQNKSGTDADSLVVDGTRIHLVSAGIEGSPLKNQRDMLRLFAVVGYGWGDNANTAGTMLDRQLHFEAGVKFKADLLYAFRSACRRWGRDKKSE